MILILGVVTLVSGGMEQTNEYVRVRIGWASRSSASNRLPATTHCTPRILLPTSRRRCDRRSASGKSQGCAAEALRLIRK
jgi:hypothetical protein